jgi:hypothetical protein
MFLFFIGHFYSSYITCIQLPIHNFQFISIARWRRGLVSFTCRNQMTQTTRKSMRVIDLSMVCQWAPKWCLCLVNGSIYMVIGNSLKTTMRLFPIWAKKFEECLYGLGNRQEGAGYWTLSTAWDGLNDLAHTNAPVVDENLLVILGWSWIH